MQRTLQNEQEGIKLPRFLGARNLPGLFSVCSQISKTDGPILLDGQDLSFVDPLGIGVLGALLEPIKDTRPATINWLSVEMGSYLDRMDVLTRCGIQGVESRCGVRHDRRDRLVELQCVTYAHEVDQAAERLATAVAGTLTKENPNEPPNDMGRNSFDSFRYPLSYVLRELLLNALSHARKEGYGNAAVWVAAQYFENQVQLSVVDNGCGILATLMTSPKLRTKDHASAISTALQPFVSCNPDIGLPGGTSNRGIGLTTSNRIAGAARGGMYIASGNASINTATHNLAQAMAGDAFWPGTAILLTFRRSSLPTVNIPSLFPEVPDAPPFEVRFES